MGTKEGGDRTLRGSLRAHAAGNSRRAITMIRARPQGMVAAPISIVTHIRTKAITKAVTRVLRHDKEPAFPVKTRASSARFRAEKRVEE